jgi:hypothetical protein
MFVCKKETVLFVLTWPLPSPTANGLDDFDSDGEWKVAIFLFATASRIFMEFIK